MQKNRVVVYTVILEHLLQRRPNRLMACRVLLLGIDIDKHDKSLSNHRFLAEQCRPLRRVSPSMLRSGTSAEESAVRPTRRRRFAERVQYVGCDSRERSRL